MRLRVGFSLVEAIVALVLFEIAALALTATTAVVTRDLAAADRHARAYAVATDRVARLRPAACTDATSGSLMHANGLHEHWRVQATASVRMVVDSVALPPHRGRPGFVIVRGWEVCAP
jgi:Tfp pilus assembly protein PilV